MVQSIENHNSVEVEKIFNFRDWKNNFKESLAGLDAQVEEILIDKNTQDLSQSTSFLLNQGHIEGYYNQDFGNNITFDDIANKYGQEIADSFGSGKTENGIFNAISEEVQNTFSTKEAVVFGLEEYQEDLEKQIKRFENAITEIKERSKNLARESENPAYTKAGSVLVNNLQTIVDELKK